MLTANLMMLACCRIGGRGGAVAVVAADNRNKGPRGHHIPSFGA